MLKAIERHHCLHLQAYQLHQERANQKLMQKYMKKRAQYVAAGMPLVGGD